MLTMIAMIVAISVAMVMTGYYNNVDNDSDGGDVSGYGDDWLLRQC